mmetsp:Transcript_121073/g.337873  ORF Transcript_121073/g.337873 Transcript_121073/m.337873 type:complete len:334 (-) Transcript_121073:515-1516(-)
MDERPEVEVEGKVPIFEHLLGDTESRCVLLALHPPQVVRAPHGVHHAAIDHLSKQREAEPVLLALGPLVGAVGVPGEAQSGLHLPGHRPVVVHPGRGGAGDDLVALLPKLLHCVALQRRFLGLGSCSGAVCTDDAHPEDVREVLLGAEAPVRAGGQPPVEPVVVVDELQHLLLVERPVPRDVAVPLHGLERFVDAVGAVVGRGRKLARRIRLQVGQHEHHHEHQADHPPGGQLGQLLRDPALGAQLGPPDFDVDVLPVFVVARIGASLAAPPRLPRRQYGLVELQDAHEPDDPHDARDPRKSYRPRVPQTIHVLLIPLEHFVYLAQVKDERAG